MAKPFDDKNGVFSYEKSFKEWLEKIFSSRASSDYPSRLRKFFTRFYKDGNWVIQEKPIYNSLNKVSFDYIQKWFDYCLCQADNIADKHDRSNIKSAINKFRLYLQERNL